jgi:hypothetical protein
MKVNGREFEAAGAVDRKEREAFRYLQLALRQPPR